MLCVYCYFAGNPDSKKVESVKAEFTVDGQSVCSDHVDAATDNFGRSLLQVQQELDNGI